MLGQKLCRIHRAYLSDWILLVTHHATGRESRRHHTDDTWIDACIRMLLRPPTAAYTRNQHAPRRAMKLAFSIPKKLCCHQSNEWRARGPSCPGLRGRCAPRRQAHRQTIGRRFAAVPAQHSPWRPRLALLEAMCQCTGCRQRNVAGCEGASAGCLLRTRARRAP